MTVRTDHAALKASGELSECARTLPEALRELEDARERFHEDPGPDTSYELGRVRRSVAGRIRRAREALDVLEGLASHLRD